MPQHNAEFALILNHTVRVARRSGYSSTAMGGRRPTGETTVLANASVFFYMNQGDFKMRQEGNFQKGDFTMMALPTLDIQPGDLIYPTAGIAGFTYGEVLNVMPYQDFAGLTHHIDVHIKKIG